MSQIDLSQKEMDLLRQILHEHLSELSYEIAFTDRKDFRQFLEKQKEFMEEFIPRLEAGRSSGIET